MYEYARSFPIKKINDDKTIKKVSLLVDNILSYNKRFSELQKNQSTEKDRLKKEIQKLDHEIDEEVYKLYGITADEKQIIEDSLK